MTRLLLPSAARGPSADQLELEFALDRGLVALACLRFGNLPEVERYMDGRSAEGSLSGRASREEESYYSFVSLLFVDAQDRAPDRSKGLSKVIPCSVRYPRRVETLHRTEPRTPAFSWCFPFVWNGIQNDDTHQSRTEYTSSLPRLVTSSSERRLIQNVARRQQRSRS